MKSFKKALKSFNAGMKYAFKRVGYNRKVDPGDSYLAEVSMRFKSGQEKKRLSKKFPTSTRT